MVKCKKNERLIMQKCINVMYGYYMHEMIIKTDPD